MASLTEYSFKAKIVSREYHVYKETTFNNVNPLVPDVLTSLLKFSCLEQMTFDKIKNFVDSLYDYEYSGVNDKESSHEEEAAIVHKIDQSKPVNHTVADQSKLVSYTDSSREEEEDLHVDVNFDQPIDLVLINFLFLK